MYLIILALMSILQHPYLLMDVEDISSLDLQFLWIAGDVSEVGPNIRSIGQWILVMRVRDIYESEQSVDEMRSTPPSILFPLSLYRNI